MSAFGIYVPCRTRAYDRTVMSRLLYPTELRVRKATTTPANKKNGHRLDNNGFHSFCCDGIFIITQFQIKN